MKWAETADFRGEVPKSWNVMPNSIAPSAADTLANVKSGLLIGVSRTQASTSPLPIVFSVVFLTPKHEQIKNQVVIDSLLEVSRRGKVQIDDVIPLAGLSANRVVVTHEPDGHTSYGVYAMTPNGILACTAQFLPATDYAQVSADLDRFVSGLKLLP